MSKKLDLKTLKENYDIAIFDMDGVITSEQTYWDIAALTAYEYINSKTYFGSGNLSALEMFDNLKAIRSEILCDDQMISLCKNIGVNSNWDLAYVTIGLRLELKTGAGCIDYIENCPNLQTLYEQTALFLSKKSGIPVEDCRRERKLWDEMVSCYQEWYMGHDEFIKRYQKQPLLDGKPFLGSCEQPFLDLEKLEFILKDLKENGISLGIATGRNYFEISTPLKRWGIYDLFNEKRIVTYDNVQEAEAVMHKKGVDISFAKPAPYSFIKAALGNDFSDEKIAYGDYKTEKRILAVGDAGADIFAAQNAGFDFFAVLTGVNGTKARGFFEENGADYINVSLLDVLE